MRKKIGVNGVNIFIFAILQLLFLLVKVSPVISQGEIEQETIKLIVGETKIIPTRSPSRVVIGNPQVADVTDVTDSEISINAKSSGTTTLVYWDIFGEQSCKIKVFTEDINEIKRRIDKTLEKLNLSEVHTEAEEDENRVVIFGRVKTPQEKEKITLALGSLKDKTADLIEIREEEAVVEIDVQIMELSKDATRTLGFSMPGSITVGEPSNRFSKTLRGGPDAIFHIFDWPRSSDFSATVDFLAQEGKARILSRPRLACQSGKEAELLVGGEKPIFTTSAQATVGSSTSVEYKEYGIKLKIKPTVNDEKQIKLSLNVEVSEVGAAETIGASNAPTAKAYPLTKRSTSTELFLNNGQTLAIGGLIKRKAEEDIRKTPGLGGIPLLGLFFRQRVTKIGGGQGERGEMELFIALTPKIIATKEAGIRKTARSEVISTALDGVMPGYAQIVQKRIMENLSYPTSAKEAGFQGTVKLSLRIYFSGELLEASVKNSSGYKILDDDAFLTAQSIGTYPPFPPSIKQKELWIDIPITYQLD